MTILNYIANTIVIVIIVGFIILVILNWIDNDDDNDYTNRNGYSIFTDEELNKSSYGDYV